MTFSRKRGEEEVVVKLNDEHEMVPPPRMLFPRIMKVLRWVGRKAAENPKSSFRFVYTETGDESRLEWFISHDPTKDLYVELADLLGQVQES